MSNCPMCGRPVAENESEYTLKNGVRVCYTCAEHINDLGEGINPYAVSDAKKYIKKYMSSTRDLSIEQLLNDFLHNPKQSILVDAFVKQDRVATTENLFIVDHEDNNTANTRDTGYRSNDNYSSNAQVNAYSTPLISRVFIIFAVICWLGGTIQAISVSGANRGVGLDAFTLFVIYFVAGCINIAIASVIKYLSKIEHSTSLLAEYLDRKQ